MSQPIGRRGALILGGAGLGGIALGGVAGSAVAEEEADGVRLVVISANIGRPKPGVDNRKESIRKVRNASKRPLVGWQEICEGDLGERAMIKQYFRGLYDHVALWKSREPTSVPHPWKVHNWWITKTHRGLRGWSPARSITETVVQHKEHPDLVFSFLNTHYIANAWNGRDDEDQPKRRRRWKKHFRIHKERMATLHDKGRLVIWTGDVNRQDMPKVHPDERRAFHNGIDLIGWVPGSDGTKLSLVKTKTVGLTVDGHDAKVAVFRIRHT